MAREIKLEEAEEVHCLRGRARGQGNLQRWPRTPDGEKGGKVQEQNRAITDLPSHGPTWAPNADMIVKISLGKFGVRAITRLPAHDAMLRTGVLAILSK